ncbi:doublecortin domain-containing protein 2-like [Penaeus monodon]|uniref:doublecortin domain-containing protein 2-like n=1 Tax=Penaeus monodon TaxID=6687 RepID=UPI0018A761F8|nr:doublecortin domain-containing protein 2-like [Penaeus monodon]
MANRQLPEGKRIHVYRSGDVHYSGASLVVNPLQVKTLDNLLTDVTSKVEPNWGAVRSIHTPNQGTVIKNLEDLNKRGVYVAAGPKGFVSIPGGYENIGKPLPKNKLHDSQKTIRKVGVRSEHYSVSLYKNGLEDAPVVFKYSSKDFSNWDQVLYRMSEQVKLPQGPIKR